MAQENAIPVNEFDGYEKVHCLTDDEIGIFREDYLEKDREIQRNIGIYLSGLVLITGWLIGPQTKPLIKMALDNFGYNLFGFLTVVALNVVFTCFLIYKSLIIHEIMQFVVVHSKPESGLNYWEAWRRSSQSATKNGGVRVIYNGLILTALPLSVSMGILIPLGYLIHWGNPQNLAEQLKQFETPPAIATANPQENSPPNIKLATTDPAPANNQATSNTSSNSASVNSQNTVASPEQLKFIFNLVFWFFWGVVLLHFFPLWFFFQNIGPINARWKIINSRQIMPKLYENLEKIYACNILSMPETEIKSAQLLENKIETKEPILDEKGKKPAKR